MFGPFATYNVENREKRVACITADTGVPMSIQWDTKPYYYPIQIAQYALEHYSKNITESAPSCKMVAAGAANWHVRAADVQMKDAKDEHGRRWTTVETREWIALDLSGVDSMPIITMNVTLVDVLASLRITLTVLETGEAISIDYIQESVDTCVKADASDRGRVGHRGDLSTICV